MVIIDLGLSPSTVGSANWFQEWLKKKAHWFSQWISRPYLETPSGGPRVLLALSIGLNNSLELRHIGLPNCFSNRTPRHSDNSLQECLTVRILVGMVSLSFRTYPLVYTFFPSSLKEIVHAVAVLDSV